MATKRTKEELYGHDPELKRALDDLTHGKDGDDPMHMAPPAAEPGPAFDANRFQQKTAPPGFLEFARTAVSPALKLEREEPKPARPKPAASIAGVPVYSAPMAPPMANEQTLEMSPVLLAGGVTAEGDPRRADTLLKIRIAPQPFAAGDDAIVQSSLTKRVDTQRLMRRIVGGVIVLALLIVGAVVVLSPSSRLSNGPKGDTSIDTPVAAAGRTKPIEPATTATTAPAAASTLLASSQVTPTPAPSSGSPQPVSTKPEPPIKLNAAAHTGTAVRPEIRPSLEPARPALPVEPKPARVAPALAPDDMPIFDKKPMPSATSAN